MSVTYRRDDAIAVITMDDGKVNVLGPAMLDEIDKALDQAEADGAGAVVLAGNHKVFSGGFDLKVFGSGDPQAALAMLKAGFELSHRLLSFRRPVVAAITGHAIAMGAFLACSVDHRIAAPGYKFHANEVINGMVIPWPGLEILKLRLTRSAYQQAVGLSRVYVTDTALAGGWVDELAMPDLVLERAVEAAKEFAATLNAAAHYASKMRARQETLDAMRRGIDEMHKELGL
ncbi:MAG: crotonase/enoyl-CoA hydratase family protein [Mycobacterium sp.]|nr:crotonase/enoyl-CoA hydratase family protein [Mycobacterium sp.]